MIDKRETITRAVEQGETHIVLDAHQPGVDVPDHLRSDSLTLKISKRYEFKDLTIDDWGVSQTLSFSGVSYYVRIPWHALYAAQSKEKQCWVWQVPPEPPKFAKRRGILGVVQ